MSKHTAGPWMARDADGIFLEDHSWSVDNADANTSEFAPIHANGKVVALVVSTDWDSTELLANAALIAAAPELLEAAKTAEKAIDILWVSHHANRSDDALEKLRAAIAKATGA